MKKKLLFVIGILTPGGAEKSLISMLHSIDYKLYDVDLFVFNKTGIFLELIPQEVNVIENEVQIEAYFSSKFFDSIIKLIKLRRFDLLFWRICLKFISGYGTLRGFNAAQRSQLSWVINKHVYKMRKGYYNAAIGYLQTTPVYYIVDRVKAKKKIAWMHTDYSASKANPDYDAKYYNNVDHIFTVSNDCLDILKSSIPQHIDKMSVCHNIISENLISNMAKEGCSYRDDFDGFAILTVASYRYPKGVDLAVEACRLLIESKRNIRWFLIGPYQNDELKELVKEKGVQEHFILLGTTLNPYKYVKRCDIYVQPSRYEGHSIAIEEAKLLQKPIVATSYRTVSNQLQDHETGIITDISAEGICIGIIKLLDNDELKQRLISNLHRTKRSNESEIQKLYDVIGG